MSVEELGLGALQEGNNSQEVSEEEKKKVQEDSKKAKQIKKQIKNQNDKSKKLANFLAKILGRYFDSLEIISYVYKILNNIEEKEEDLHKIFYPFLEGNGFNKVSEFVIYIKENNIPTKEYIDLLVSLIETEKIGGEDFWKNLDNSNGEVSKKEFIEQIRNELLK